MPARPTEPQADTCCVHLNLHTSSQFPFSLLFHTKFLIQKDEEAVVLFYFFSFLCLKRSFALVAQAGVQWSDLGSPQPSPPMFK